MTSMAEGLEVNDNRATYIASFNQQITIGVIWLRIMTMVNKMKPSKKHMKWIAVVFFVSIYYCYRTGVFIQPKGTLLAGGFRGVYAISLDDGKPGNLFFADSAYDSYHSPLMENADFFCVGIQKEQQNGKDISAIFMVKGGDPQEQKPEIVFKTSGNIIRFVINRNRGTIFYTKNGKLFKYEKESDAETQIHLNASTSIEDTRMLLLNERFIICTITNSKDDRLYSIAQIDTVTGELKILSQNSRLFTWLEKDKSILYCNPDREIYSYDLQSEKSEKMGATNLIVTGAVSPDKEYLLAWGPQELSFEFDLESGFRLIFPQHGTDECYIISVSGKQAKKMDFLKMSEGVSDKVCWIP